MRFLSLVCLLVAILLAVPPAFASDTNGWLHLRRYADVELQGGVQHANLYVFDAEGNAVTAPDGSQAHPAGSYVAVPPGWYFVSVGTRFSRHNVVRMQVVADRATVVPAGWVSAHTVPVDEQPTGGCARWTAELTASVYTADGTQEIIATNAQQAPTEFGMIQVPAGTVTVHFNGFPVVAEVRADQEFRIPLGYQDPVLGDRAQISLTDGSGGANVTRDLCTNGALHVPAGNYFVSSMSRGTSAPFEQRVYTAVTIEPWDWTGYSPLRQPELEHSRYSGEGSEAVSPGPEHAEVLARLGGAGARPRLPGLGRP